MRTVARRIGKGQTPRPFAVREGYQGKPMPVGAKPPKGPAIDVPVKKVPDSK